MIMTCADGLPSPGTAMVRDACNGHFTQCRICRASSSSRLARCNFAIEHLFQKAELRCRRISPYPGNALRLSGNILAHAVAHPQMLQAIQFALPDWAA